MLRCSAKAITELPNVKHCEARVLDGQRLAAGLEAVATSGRSLRARRIVAWHRVLSWEVLLASGAAELSEAELKATAAALGRGYVLSQVPRARCVCPTRRN